MDNENTEKKSHLERLTGANKAAYDQSHSLLVQRLRLILPLIALGIIVILMTWSEISEEQTISVKPQEEQERTIGQNELVDPRFESTDDKKQPYTITATRAVQGEENDNLVILEAPLADILLNNNTWIAIEAEKGAFREDTQRLLLQDNVKMYHDLGYRMETPQLNVDMVKEYAWSETDVYAQGPEGTLEAAGMEVFSGAQRLVFTGPAKLTLNQSVKGLNE